MTEFKVLGIVAAVIVLVDDPVMVHESFYSLVKFCDVLVHFVVAGCVLGELELVGIDGHGSRNEGSKCEGLHMRLTRMDFIIN